MYVLCILFHCLVLCIVCVLMCIVLLSPGVKPTAVNKIHHIIYAMSKHNIPETLIFISKVDTAHTTKAHREQA